MTATRAMMHEYRALSVARHKNVLQIICHAFVADNKRLCSAICTELVEGSDLFKMATNYTEYTNDEKRSVFSQLIAAVDHCHNCSVAHRDIKPENILISKEGVVKLADFGLSTVNEMSVSTRCGSMPYVGPESFTEHSFDPFKCDCWSVGVVLFMATHGFQAMHYAHVKDPVFAKMVKAPISPTRVICKHWDKPAGFADDIIDRLLQIDPLSRMPMWEARLHPDIKHVDKKM